MTCQDFGLTPDAIRKYVVAIAPPAKPTDSTSKIKERYKAMGLTTRGTIPVYRNKKHPDLDGLSRRDYNREVARRWRAAHANGMSSGQPKAKQ
jgi:hypothetical protein